MRVPVTVDAEKALLEREHELAVLTETLAGVDGGAGGALVLVSGEAGVGKTALLQHFCQRRKEGTRILWGSCESLFTPRPLGPFADIAATVGGRLERVVAAEEPVQSAFDALLAELSGGDAVLVIEDVHWADEATLDVLRLLGRRVERLGALVVVTYRSDELPRTHPLRVVLGDVATAAGVVRLRLNPLSPDAVAELARPLGVDAEDLYAKTAGNPFFVTEALASGGAGAVPATVRDAVLARAARLEPQARELLDAVAVVPPRSELWLLEAIAGAAMPALDECVASGMLRFDDQAVAFRHELARLTIEESINPHRRRELHRTALRALRSRACRSG